MSAVTPDRFASVRLNRLTLVFILIGAVTFVAGLMLAPERSWAALLAVSFHLIVVGLGAAFFIGLQFCTGAHWCVAIRRVPEAMCAALPVGAIGLLAVLIFYPSLYPWFDPSPELAEGLTGFKGLWLNRSFFLARTAAYLILWILLTRAMVRTSRRQDVDGDPAHSRKYTRLAAGFIAVFAITFWLASFDWIMSLEPLWYSSIFGVYNFAGGFLGTLAVITILAVWLRNAGPLRGVLTSDHLHDLGKLIFAFSSFWMYTWFSQYMLIWYVNFAEEAEYFVLRHQGAWASLTVLNLFLTWVIPFVALLSRSAKRNAGVMVKVCVVILLGRSLDLYMMITPSVVGAESSLGLFEIGMLLGGAGAFLYVFLRAFGLAQATPANDPLLRQSLQHHQ